MRKRWLALLLACTLAVVPAAYTFAFESEEAPEEAPEEEDAESLSRFGVVTKYFGKAKDEIIPLLSELGVITEEDISDAAAGADSDGSDEEPRFIDKVSDFASEFRDDVTPFVSWLADELKYSMNSTYVFSDWNEGAPAVEVLREYVEDVTDPDSENYIPADARVAVFDMDGTLYVEQAPIYASWMAFADRALKNPEFADDEDMQSTAQLVLQAAYDRTYSPDLFGKEMEQELKAYAGMTVPEYNSSIDEFLGKDVWGFEGMKYGNAFIKPMVQVVEYLKAYGFKIYLVSGADRMFLRETVRDYLPIDPEHVIGFDCILESPEDTEEGAASSGELVRSGEYSERDFRLNKAMRIAREIGRQPVLCFGNASNDDSMAAYTVNGNPYRTEVFMVVDDDDVRDWADTKEAAALRKEWEGSGRNIISMKDDFRTIYGDDVVRAKEMPEIEGLIIPEEPVYTEYVVQPYDNLWKIAAKVYGDGAQYRRIAEANNIAAPYEVSTGQVLMVPDAQEAD